MVAPELSKAIGVQGDIKAGTVVILCYAGLSSGDFLSGLVSQLLRSRKKTIYWFVGSSIILMCVYLLTHGLDTGVFYFLCFALGFSGGYWAVFITMASEQFGTNIRATVTTTVPNFVRGALILITLGFKFLMGYVGLIYAALIVGCICNFGAFIS